MQRQYSSHMSVFGLLVAWGATALVLVTGQETHYIKHHSNPHKSSSHAVAIVQARLRERVARRDLRNSSLQGLLRQYQFRHLECTTPGQGKPCPYVLVKAANKDNGIGNRLPGVITGFLLALLLDRCLFVDFPIFNNGFAHELNFLWEDQHQLLMKEGYNFDSGGGESLQLPESSTPEEVWLMTDLVEKYRNIHALELSREYDYSIGLIQSNPHHKAFIEEYFPDGEIFASLSSYLLQLNQHYSARLRGFQDKHFRLYNIGIQIRREKCSLDKQELFCEDAPTATQFCQVAKSIQMTMGLHDDDVAFFLAADTRGLYQEVARTLGEERVIWTDNGIAPHSIDNPQAELPAERNQANNPGTLEAALLDLALLSTCDDIVLTLGSSFGYVAAAMGGIAPVHMLHGKHTSVQNPYFYRAISSEPCMYGAKRLLQTMDEEYRRQFQSGNMWMQYSQCHPFSY